MYEYKIRKDYKNQKECKIKNQDYYGCSKELFRIIQNYC